MEDEAYTVYPRIYKEVRIGPPYLTKYERTRIIGVRSLQLNYGAPPLIPIEKVGTSDTLEIAKYEVDKGILPVSVYRYTEGGLSQSIPLKVLIEATRKVIGDTG